jgi:deazaflavin-dependent oxidoreductase (nitroreductase family)
MSEMRDFNQAIIEEFRGNHGVVGGGFTGASMVLLTTTGAKSGQQRVNPLVCLPEDHDTLYVFASKAGAPSDPDWYRNLSAHPDVTVEFGDERYEATATTISGPERDAIYARQVERFATFGDYAKQTTRTIPVVALTRK